MYAVKLGTQLDIAIIGKKTEQSFLDFCYENIGCQCVEKVNARYLKEPFVLMIDGEGRLKDKPAINFIASYLYGAHEHHEPIVGNVLIMKMGMTNEGPDILPLNEVETRQVEESMKKMLRAFFLHIGVVDRASAKHNYRREAKKVAREVAAFAVVRVARVAEQFRDAFKLANVEACKQFQCLFGDVLLFWGESKDVSLLLRFAHFGPPP